MNSNRDGGFTIIELMLFLSISALMMITLLTGWTVAINTQSYRDATRSLAAALQAEYNQTTNVINDRAASFNCVKASGAVNITQTVTPGTGESRGTSNCLVLGRYVMVDNDTFRSTAVLGIEPTTPIPSGTSDHDTLVDYLPTKLDPALIEGTSEPIPWVSKTYVSSGDQSPIRTAFLIVRSPETGTVYTYHLDVADSAPEPSAAAIMAANNTSKKTICFDPGAPVAQPRSAVVVSANAISASAINVITDPTATGC